MEKLLKQLEKARKDLGKAYELDDWDGINTCSMELYKLQMEIKQAERGANYGIQTQNKRHMVY